MYFLVLLSSSIIFQYIEEVVECPTDHREIRNHRSGVHTQTFDIFHQDNDFLEAGKSHFNPQTRPLIDVRANFTPLPPSLLTSSSSRYSCFFFVTLPLHFFIDFLLFYFYSQFHRHYRYRKRSHRI